jgi:hypothetical protein
VRAIIGREGGMIGRCTTALGIAGRTGIMRRCIVMRKLICGGLCTMRIVIMGGRMTGRAIWGVMHIGVVRMVGIRIIGGRMLTCMENWALIRKGHRWA